MKGAKRASARCDLETLSGVAAAIRKAYPPDAAADERFEGLLDRLRGEPLCAAPTTPTVGRGASQQPSSRRGER